MLPIHLEKHHKSTLNPCACLPPAHNREGRVTYPHAMRRRLGALLLSLGLLLGLASQVNAQTANAGPDQTVAEGATVTLDGSGSNDKRLRLSPTAILGLDY